MIASQVSPAAGSSPGGMSGTMVGDTHSHQALIKADFEQLAWEQAP